MESDDAFTSLRLPSEQVRLRPMLVFSNDEMEVLLVAMRKVLSEMDVAHSH